MRDASGQIYMRNRYYDPATGQFTQQDPIGLAGGLNAYGFAAGDPITYGDPYGLLADTLKFNGRTLTLVGDDGKVKWEGSATSGREGSGPEDQDVEDYGPLPQGRYTVDPTQISHVTGLRYLARNATGDWGHYRVGIEPTEANYVYGRGGFMLHGGKLPGSAGCIDVGSGESTLFPLLQAQSSPIPLVVDYIQDASLWRE